MDRERGQLSKGSSARLRHSRTDSGLERLAANGRQFSKKSKPWAYWGQHDDFIVVVPPGTCDEVKNVDVDKLSFLQAVEDVRSCMACEQSLVIADVHRAITSGCIPKSWAAAMLTLSGAL